MHGVALIILQAVVLPAYAAQQDFMDTLADSLINKLFNKLSGSQLAVPRRSTLFLSPYASLATRVQPVHGIGSTTLEHNFALKAVDANSRGNRELSLRPRQAEMVTQGIIQDTVQDNIQDSIQDAIQESIQDTVQNTVQDTSHDAIEDTIQDAIEKSIQDSIEASHQLRRRPQVSVGQ